tara:strand:- start:223 stop:507 length:285 start_codon:yes stop_codon:yes gene_type:complete
MQVWGFDLGPWEVFGLLGNTCFGSRFLVQWIQSERAGRSIVPEIFWYLSLGGSVILLIYFFQRGSIIGVLAYLPNFVPYTRNLMLIAKEKKMSS